MMWPPSVVRIRIAKGGRRKLNLWLPVFLLWPLGVVFGIAATPFVVLALIGSRRAGLAWRILKAGPRVFAVFCSLRGLSVRVSEPDEEVYIAIW